MDGVPNSILLELALIFGVSFYYMLIGALPFTACDPMEWIHWNLSQQRRHLGLPPANKPWGEISHYGATFLKAQVVGNGPVNCGAKAGT